MPASAPEREVRAIDDCLRRVQCGTEVAAWLFAIAILVVACVGPRPAHATEAARPAIPVRFTLDKPGVVTLVVDDAQGNRVRNLIAETPFAAGEHVVEWDGLDDHVPVQVDAQPVFRFEGEPAVPGRYVIRGLVRDPLQLRYDMPFYTAGNPPWDTIDGRGGWLNDFGPALAVASLPAKKPSEKPDETAAETPAMLVGSGVGEAFGLVWTDLEGQRLAGVRGIAAGGGWCGAELLARDGGPGAAAAVTAYAGNNWQDSFEIEAVAQQPPVGAYHGAVRTMSMCLWAAGRRVYRGDAGQSLGGLVVYDRVVVAAVTSQNKLLVIRDEPKQDGPQPGFALRHADPTVPDHRSGVKAAEVSLDSPRGMVVTADGRHLLAISGQRVVRFSFPPQGEPTVLVGEGLEKPQHLALDGDGNLYVSDQGPHQVLVFDREGRRLRAIGVPGGPQLGPYDERRMANPRGIAISADGRLWVAEASEFPRRISVWERDGTFVKAMYGNNNYGGGGMVDAGDRTRAYVTQGGGALQLRLDWEKGTSAIEKILWLPDERRSLPGVAYHVGYARVMGHAVYHRGQRYLSNAYCTASGGGNHSDHTITLWKVDDESQKSVPVASVGEAQAWGVLKQPEFATRWPAGVDPKGEPRANFALYAWSDLNDNGTPDPDEVQMVSKPEWKTRGNPGTVTLGEDLAIVDCLGNRYRPVQFTKAGAPQYDLTKSDNIFPTAQPTGTTGGGQVIDGGNGWAVTTWSPEGIPGGYVAGAKDGVVRWRYPARAIGNHAGYVVGPPDKPGELIALSSLAGPPFTPRGTKERLWATVGLKGNLHVMTTDGLFVATLFKDYRQGKPGPEKADRGAILSDMSLGDDAWSTTLTQSSDGTISIVGGHDSNWVTRVDGLESIRRLPESEVTIVEPPAQWLEGYTAGGFRRKLTIEKTSRSDRSLTDVPVLVKLTPERFDFANSTPAGTDIRFTAADGVTLLDFERVRHDAEAGEASYWVRVPRIWPHGVNCYVYYRPTPNADLADGAKMWAAKSYRAVLHMDETEGDRLIDATSHERHLARGNRPLNAEGKVGAGIGPGTTGDRTDGMLDGSFTLSMWIRPTAHNTTLAAADIPGTSATYAFSLTPDGMLKTWVHNSHSIEEMVGTTVVPLNEWTHVAHAYGAGGGQQTLYVNGVPETSRYAARVWGGGGRFFFGNFNGVTDEVRLAEGALTAQRIKTEYLSERDGLVRYGDREAFPAAP